MQISKMIKLKKSLNGKFIITFLGILFTLFVSLVSLVQILIIVQVRSYVYNNIFNAQSEMDKSVTSVMDEVAYLYARLIRSENVEPWNMILDDTMEYETKQQVFSDLLIASSINDHFFGNVVFITNTTSLSLNNTTELPRYDFINKVNTINQPFVLGESARGYIEVGKRLQSIAIDGEGIIIFYIKEKAIEEIGYVLDEGIGYSFALTSDYSIVTHRNDELVGKTIYDKNLFSLDEAPYFKTKNVDGKKSIIIVSQASSLKEQYGLNCYIISVLDYNTVFSDMQTLNVILITIGAATFLFVVIIAILFAKKLSSPINNLNKSITDVIKTGKRKNKSIVYEGDEIYQLEKNYDEMISKIFSYIEKNKEDMEIQRKLELDTLQMQINPHFLYNTLDAIAWIAKLKKQPEIERLVISLAKFFRISLHKGDKFITVKEEFEIIRHFIEIELIRFPDKFTIEYNLDKSIENYETLKLILQPIVENAIKHGISNMERMGRIEIKAYSEENAIVYEVIDDGIGFEPAKDIMSKKREKQGGYGLQNVNERIKLEYGKQYGLEINSKVGGGTKVTVRIKKRLTSDKKE